MTEPTHTLREQVADALRDTCRRHEVNGTCPACDQRLAAIMPVINAEIDGWRDSFQAAEQDAQRYEREAKEARAALAEMTQHAERYARGLASVLDAAANREES